MAGIRDLIKSISPSWAASGLFERYLYGCALAMDALLEKATQGAHAHMPLKADPSALPLIGNDRLVPRGLTESDANYAVRLQRAIESWQIAGNSWSVLREVLGFLLNDTPAALTVSSQYITTDHTPSATTWQSYSVGADTSKPPTFKRVVPGNWNWDSSSPSCGEGGWGGWWKWYLVLFAVSPNDWCGPAPFTFGTAGVKIGQRPDASIGLNVPASVISSIRQIVALRQAGNTYCQSIIIAFDPLMFSPSAASGGGTNPDGTFGQWSKIVSAQYVPSRLTNARYCTGVESG